MAREMRNLMEIQNVFHLCDSSIFVHWEREIRTPRISRGSEITSFPVVGASSDEESCEYPSSKRNEELITFQNFTIRRILYSSWEALIARYFAKFQTHKTRCVKVYRASHL